MTYTRVLCAILALSAVSPVAAQAPDYDLAFDEEFGLTDAQYGRRITWLRIVGWTTFGLSGVAAFAMPAYQDLTDGGLSFRQGALWWIGAGLGLMTSGVLLIAARIKVGRRRRFRRRFRERQAALDRSYFHPELDIGVTPWGLSLHLSF